MSKIIIISKDVAVQEEEFLTLCATHKSVAKLAKAVGASEYKVRACVKKYYPNKRPGTLLTILELFDKARCSTCKELLPFYKFSNSSSTQTGLMSRCKECCNENSAKFYKENQETQKAAFKKRYHENKEEASKYYGEYIKVNKDKVAAKKKEWLQTEAGSASYRAASARRRASKMQRTPSWADLEAIKEFYAKCPKGYHVDHIIPLQGAKVSGFHVLENLQYLTPYENYAKNNRYEV